MFISWLIGFIITEICVIAITYYHYAPPDITDIDVEEFIITLVLSMIYSALFFISVPLTTIVFIGYQFGKFLINLMGKKNND